MEEADGREGKRKGKGKRETRGRCRALALSRNTAQLGAAVINGLHFPNRSVLRCGTQRRGVKIKRGGGGCCEEPELREKKTSLSQGERNGVMKEPHLR